MKIRKIIALFLTLLFSVSCAACTKAETSEPQGQVSQVQMKAICELATIQCYYHNVAKYKEEDATGMLLWKKDKHFWVEYSGVVKVGIDASLLVVEVKENSVTITIPEAKVLGANVDKDSLTEKSFIVDKKSAAISAEDQTRVFSEAQANMVSTASKDSALLANAQQTAKKLLEEYIANIGKAVEKEYSIEWINPVKDGVSPTNTTEVSQETQQS